MMLDPVLLRSFLAVVDTASFTRAALSVHLTQSTVSQQIRRLETQLGCELLDRSGREVSTTAEGERLLDYARRIVHLNEEAVEQTRCTAEQRVLRLGVPEDFAARPMTSVLARFADEHAGGRLEVTSGLSHDLWKGFQQGELDLALVKQRANGAPGIASWPEPLAWLDSRDRPAAHQDPVPLVVFPIVGLYRQDMTHALDAAARRWRIAYVSASLESLLAAVEDGLGVSLLPRRLARPGHRVLVALDGFEPMPEVSLTLHGRPDLSAPGKDLARRLQAFCNDVMHP